MAHRFHQEELPLSLGDLVAALRDPACYPHPAGRIDILETHMSYVLLAGEFAYKVKKAVRLPFADFSTREARSWSCIEELRLNRRTAPQVYLDVVAITGAVDAPRIGGAGAVLEHAVRMRRFSQEALLSRLAADGRLEAHHVDLLADAVAAFHDAIAGTTPPQGLGDAASVRAPADANFRELAELHPPRDLDAVVGSLRDWTRHQGRALEARFEERRRKGFVRECHGDLHLANAAMVAGQAVLFDGLEFSAALRWTDVMADVAFMFMDLLRNSRPALAWRFLSRYLEHTGDYAGLELLRFYAVYRAMVRAKVAWIRAGQLGPGHPAASEARSEFAASLALASRLAQRPSAALVVMHGVSGSGKTTVARRLAGGLGAVMLRSDVERKRLHGLAPRARSCSGLNAGIYSLWASDATYERLARLARAVLHAGYPVVVDAAFLERGRRDAFRALAQGCGAAFEVLSCRATAEALRHRLQRREGEGDASEANAAVLELQLARGHKLAAEEQVHATFVDTSAPAWRRAVDSLARRFST